MNRKDSEAFADMITTCAEDGCKRLPIRMVVEFNTDPDDEADCDMVMLCIDHAALYVPEGKVISDTIMVSEENLAMLKEIGA